MAAGQGYKEFSTGDILTAADANGYLASQVVMVFASASARTSAIASPQEGMVSYLKDTNAVEKYTGSAWESISGGGASGKVLQVVSTTKSDTFTTNATNTWTDITGMSVSITPSSATSKVLVLYDLFFMGDATANWPLMKLLRGSTDIKIGDASGSKYRATGGIGTWTNNYSPAPNTAGSYLDAPATTSATTYKLQIIKTGGTSSDYAYVNRTQADTDDNRGRYASTITVMEIGA